MSDDGRLVERGSFRVDREKALAKLERYQLADPWDFVLAWGRMAVVSKSKRVEVLALKGVSSFSWDGHPPPEALLLDPYAALFDSGGGEPGRLLAVGLLGLERLQPHRVELRAGGRTWSREANVGERTERGESVKGASLHIVWEEDSASGKAYRFSERLREALAMAELRLDVEGEVLGARHASRATEAKSWRRGRRSLVARPNAPDAALRVYRDGVLAHQEEPPEPRLDVRVDDPGIKLDLTGCKAADDAALRSAVTVAKEGARRLFPPPSSQSETGMPGKAEATFHALAAAGILVFMGFKIGGIFQENGDRLLGAVFSLGGLGLGGAWLYLAFRAK